MLTADDTVDNTLTLAFAGLNPLGHMMHSIVSQRLNVRDSF